MKSLGILGVGDLTEKVVQGLRRGDYCAPIYLCPHNQPRAESLAQSFLCKIMPDEQSVVDSADILLIGDRPDNLRALAGEITLDPSQDVISLVAGVSLTNGFAPTTTLGCGSWGGNSISENLDYKHLMNVSRIGKVIINKKVPTDAEIWA